MKIINAYMYVLLLQSIVPNKYYNKSIHYIIPGDEEVVWLIN